MVKKGQFFVLICCLHKVKSRTGQLHLLYSFKIRGLSPPSSLPLPVHCTVRCTWHNCVSPSSSPHEILLCAHLKNSQLSTYFSGSLSLSSTPLSPRTPSQAPTSPSPRNVSASARKQLSRQWWDTDCAGRRPLHGLQEKSTKLFLVFYSRVGWALLPMWTCCLLW